MKNSKLSLLALVTSVLLLGNIAYADTAPAPAGTPAAQDTKNQQNNPSGPTAQNTGTDPKKDSKKDGTTSATTPTSTMTPGAPAATKTPQKDTEAVNK